MKKLAILFFIIFSISLANSQRRSCVRIIVTNQWGTGIIKRCCCGCQLMYMVGYSGTGTCGSSGGGGGGGTPKQNINSLIKNK